MRYNITNLELALGIIIEPTLTLREFESNVAYVRPPSSGRQKRRQSTHLSKDRASIISLTEPPGFYLRNITKALFYVKQGSLMVTVRLIL